MDGSFELQAKVDSPGKLLLLGILSQQQGRSLRPPLSKVLLFALVQDSYLEGVLTSLSSSRQHLGDKNLSLPRSNSRGLRIPKHTFWLGFTQSSLFEHPQIHLSLLPQGSRLHSSFSYHQTDSSFQDSKSGRNTPLGIPIVCRILCA